MIGPLSKPVFMHQDNDAYYEYNQGGAPSMMENGVAYIPKRCLNVECEVHVALHGCSMTIEYIWY